MILFLLTLLKFNQVYSGGAFTDWTDASFTRDVVGTHNGFLGGVAFASDDDILSNTCGVGNILIRFDRSATSVVQGSTLFNKIILSGSGSGFCGMTNHPNGRLYVNTLSGVVIKNPDTNAFLGGPYGPGGNGLGIAVKYEDVYYVGSGATYKLNTATNIATLFSSHGYFVDAIAWNHQRTILWHAGRSPNFRLIGVDISGTVIHSLPLTSEPDGIAYHVCSSSIFINNLDGTITRIYESDLNTNILFASGGFRGDLSATGKDGCWYITQMGTRYESGQTSSLNSIVRICDAIGSSCFSPSLESPTNNPTQPPSIAPSIAPSTAPSMAPSISPTQPPSIAPSIAPSTAPSMAPSISPTQPPSIA
eukprot:551431_1